MLVFRQSGLTSTQALIPYVMVDGNRQAYWGLEVMDVICAIAASIGPGVKQ